MNWKGFGRKPVWGIILEISWIDWEKPQETSIRTAGVSSEIWTNHLQNTNLEHYHETILFGNLVFSYGQTKSEMYLLCNSITYRSMCLDFFLKERSVLFIHLVPYALQREKKADMYAVSVIMHSVWFPASSNSTYGKSFGKQKWFMDYVM
jgi:hypothetical protein